MTARVADSRGYVVIDSGVWKRMPELGTAVLVYIALLTHVNGRSGEAWPSHQRLSDMTGLGVSTVKLKLAALEEAGLVRTDGSMREDGGRGSNHYIIDVPPSQNLATPQPESGYTPSQNLAMNKTQLNKNTTPSGDGVKINAIIQSYWKALRDDKRMVYEKEFGRHARAAKELVSIGYSPSEVEAQTRRMTGDSFWHGKHINLSHVKDALMARGAPASLGGKTQQSVVPVSTHNPFGGD